MCGKVHNDGHPLGGSKFQYFTVPFVHLLCHSFYGDPQIWNLYFNEHTRTYHMAHVSAILPINPDNISNNTLNFGQFSNVNF